jgi:hypothetical protein
MIEQWLPDVLHAGLHTYTIPQLLPLPPTPFPSSINTSCAADIFHPSPVGSPSAAQGASGLGLGQAPAGTSLGARKLVHVQVGVLMLVCE